MMHGISSLYSREKLKLPFEPRVYLKSKYKGHETSSNDNIERNEPYDQILKYENLAKRFYSDDELQKHVKIFQSKDTEKMSRKDLTNETLVKQFEFKANILSKETSKPNIIESKKESDNGQVCLKTRKKTVKVDSEIKHEWHNPAKNIFKPFVEVNNFLFNRVSQCGF